MSYDPEDNAGRYSMSKHHRNVLNRCRIYFSRNLQLKPVIDELVSKGLINSSTEEDIFSSAVPGERLRNFLTTLPRLGPTAFSLFLEALITTHQTHIYEQVLQTERDLTPSGDISQFYNTRPKEYPVRSEEEGSRIADEYSEKDLNKKGAQGASVRDYEPVTVTHIPRYSIRSSRNVFVLIINNEDFENTDLDSRYGSEADIDNLKKLFSHQLCFNVEVQKDLSAKQMIETLREFASRNTLKTADACIVIIMTHGEDGVVVGNDRQVIAVRDIMDRFSPMKCPSLVQKPKYFIFQSCRGDEKDRGCDVLDSAAPENEQRYQELYPSGNPPESNRTPNPSRSIPKLTDTLVSYSTIPGHVSWRNKEKGSWFIQAFVKVFTQHAEKEHVLDMLTMVTNDIVTNYGENYKQLCETVSHLTKQFYLTPQVP